MSILTDEQLLTDVAAGMSGHAIAKKYGYLHMGHYHHRKVAESNMFITEMHQTLAAKDEYSSNGGYDSGRSATVITYHRDYGEIGRISIPVEMIKDRYGQLIK